MSRAEVLSNLETILGAVSEIKTVVRSYFGANFDITQYSTTDLPLVVIPEPEETTHQELTSHRAIMNLSLDLIVYFLSWGVSPIDSYESLVKAIRDKIGANFTLNGSATEARVNRISSISGNLPVYWFVIELELRYYLNETST